MMVMTEDADLNATLDTYLAKLGNGQSMQIGLSSNGSFMSEGTRLFGTLTKVYATYATFLVVGYLHKGTIALKTKYNGVWGEWEYINPPMVLGVEYRTTERWNGKPIYVTLVNFGALPNASIKTIISQIAFSGIVGVEGMVSSGGGANPISNMNGLDDIWIHGGTQMNINVMTSTDLSEKTMTLIVKYTKD